MKSGIMRIYAFLAVVIVALVIVAVLVYKAGTTYTRGRKENQTAVSPLERANILQCRAQIQKIEMAIQVYYSENNKYPERIDDLVSISPQETYCPVTGQAYIYNPENGTVICPQHH
ncbi:MAG: hypothetical protein ACUVQ3_01760 [bacterium]